MEMEMELEMKLEMEMKMEMGLEMKLEMEMKMEMGLETEMERERRRRIRRNSTVFLSSFLAAGCFFLLFPRMGALPPSTQYGHLRVELLSKTKTKTKTNKQKTNKGPELHSSKRSLFWKINTCDFL